MITASTPLVHFGQVYQYRAKKGSSSVVTTAADGIYLWTMSRSGEGSTMKRQRISLFVLERFPSGVSP